ncbi:MAG: ABC-F family ATP-binding cassette domain-containing protein [Flavobacteriales bacterium]|nr:ABC-F family ATP-binding cassette domain-containing protein [Flavobacteriales bacterium]
MYSVSNLSVHFTGEDLFKQISFLINENDKIGLVGKNGVGKSTLLKIIAGKQSPSSGEVVIPNGKKLGYLAQEFKNESARTIFGETMTVYDDISRIHAEIDEINAELGSRTDYESDAYMAIITRLSEKSEQLSHLDDGKSESNVEKVLKGLGFERKDFDRSLTEFSGGWQMRVELAKLILRKPDLMLLDEPTNHLDIESILWLEDFLRENKGALILISHDRMFLDRVTNRTVEIVNARIYDYPCSYNRYVELREERLKQQEAAYTNQQQFIAQQERFIERFRAKNTKAKQVQSKVKRLEKLERVEFDEFDNRQIRFRFPPAPRSGDIVLEAKDLNKSYGEAEILKNLGFTIHRGERVAFVGKNGEGKSTLVKMIMKQTDFDGHLRIGHNVNIGYYAQAQENVLDENKTVYDTLDSIATDEWRNISRLRGLLGSFLFREDDMDKKVKVLSGGEKSRLALARLLLNPVNLLILDEPTNHLDMSAKDVLKAALIGYDGTLVLVSHDRDFLDGLTERTFEFTNKGIRDKIGDIALFLEAHQVDTFRQFETEGKKTAEAPKKSQPESGKGKQIREKSQAAKKLSQDIERSEKEIARIEKKMKEVEKVLADPDFYSDAKASSETLNQHATLKAELEKVMKRWEELSTELEKEK